MHRSIAAQQQSKEVRTLDEIRPKDVGKQVKADTRSDDVRLSDHVGLPFDQVTRDAIIRFYGSVKATAFALSEDPRKSLDPSLMQREFADGNFKRFYKHADFEAKGFVAKELAEAYGPLNSREARIQQLKRSIEDAVTEMAALAVTA